VARKSDALLTCRICVEEHTDFRGVAVAFSNKKRRRKKKKKKMVMMKTMKRRSMKLRPHFGTDGDSEDSDSANQF